MRIVGTSFSLTLGVWRLFLHIGIDEVTAEPPPVASTEPRPADARAPRVRVHRN